MYVFIFYLSSGNYWEIAAHLAYDMFSWYKYLSVNLVFPTPRFLSGIFFLIAPFPDHCLLYLSLLYLSSLFLVDATWMGTCLEKS